ncbi:hypothetical protein EDD22DRAFT_848365 [Suillus occidentalis]|nr:hypothetical protein EDD22DRAFT_848365 [Suillus occidentalis]
MVYEEIQMQASQLSLLPYTKELEHVKGQLRCSEHSEENTFCWVEKSQPGAPHYPLCTRDLQEWAKYLFEIGDPDNACTIMPNKPHFDELRKTRKDRTVSLQRVPTEPIIYDYNHHSPQAAVHAWQSSRVPAPQPLKRTYACIWRL